MVSFVKSAACDFFSLYILHSLTSVECLSFTPPRTDFFLLPVLCLFEFPTGVLQDVMNEWDRWSKETSRGRNNFPFWFVICLFLLAISGFVLQRESTNLVSWFEEIFRVSFVVTRTDEKR